jgi:hypothetical protein
MDDMTPKKCASTTRSGAEGYPSAPKLLANPRVSTDERLFGSAPRTAFQRRPDRSGPTNFKLSCGHQADPFRSLHIRGSSPFCMTNPTGNSIFFEPGHVEEAVERRLAARAESRFVAN